MNLGSVASRVRNGETVTFVAVGNSMTPRVESGSEVTVAPRTEVLHEWTDQVEADASVADVLTAMPMREKGWVLMLKRKVTIE